MPFFGEYQCKIDSKGRLRLPSHLIRQFSGDVGLYSLVIQRGFEKNLILYEKQVWERIIKDVEGLNVYNKKERQFLRYFFRGATITSLDSADRILLTKPQLEYAGIEKDVVLTPLNDRIEIWSSAQYGAMLAEEPGDLAALAEQVLGGIREETKDE
jgi:MraZ protein